MVVSGARNARPPRDPGGTQETQEMKITISATIEMSGFVLDPGWRIEQVVDALKFGRATIHPENEAGRGCIRLTPLGERMASARFTVQLQPNVPVTGEIA